MGGTARDIRDYPWQALERVGRRKTREVARARRVAAAAGVRTLTEASRALSELVGAEIEVVVRSLGRARRPNGAKEILLAVGDALTVGAALEPDGAAALLSRLLGRQVALAEPELALGSPLNGALAALGCEAARRLSSEPVRLATLPEGRPVELELTLLVDGRPYALALRVWASAVEPESAPNLALLADSALELRLVAALSWARPSELESLQVGDAWFPGEGWFLDRSLTGRAVLASETGERGVWVDLAPGGKVVLRQGTAALPLDTMATDGSTPTELADVALEAPVVVRVELASVSLSAREVASLKPGDVLESRRRVGEPVVLRVGGRAIAKGDLVDVEGELGVRIREILEPAP
jgi:type III secretion system YscQ/HrcQ family protein